MEPTLIFLLFLLFLVINTLVHELWVGYKLEYTLGYAIAAITIVIVEALFFIFFGLVSNYSK